MFVIFFTKKQNLFVSKTILNVFNTNKFCCFILFSLLENMTNILGYNQEINSFDLNSTKYVS